MSLTTEIIQIRNATHMMEIKFNEGEVPEVKEYKLEDNPGLILKIETHNGDGTYHTIHWNEDEAPVIE